MSKFNQIDALKLANEVIISEVAAINNLKKTLGKNLYLFCKAIHECKGKLIITGVGKSGHIANKLSATFLVKEVVVFKLLFNSLIRLPISEKVFLMFSPSLPILFIFSLAIE